MAEMSSIERVRAVLAGQVPDRPPVSFWYHFRSDCVSGKAAVDAHLEHLARFGLDFLKVMNDNRYPTTRTVRSAADLRDLPVLQGDEASYAQQLELIRNLARELSGKVLLSTTLFNAWAILRRLVTPPESDKHNPPQLGGPARSVDSRVQELLTEDRPVVADALDAIATSQANFARKCIEAGADGVFLSVRDDWLGSAAGDRSTYTDIIRPGDLKILSQAAAAPFNLLHVCGVAQDFESFANYPVHVVNWADRVAGPAIGEVIGRIKPLVCGGVDNLDTLPNGRPEDVCSQVRDALAQAGDHPIIVSAGCTYDPDAVPSENLDALVRTVREHHAG